jgi:hypothetical protein
MLVPKKLEPYNHIDIWRHHPQQDSYIDYRETHIANAGWTSWIWMDSYNLSSASLGPWRSTNGGRKERSNWSCAYLCTCNVCKAWSKDHLGSVEKQKMHKVIEADWRLLKRYLRTLAIFRCSGKNSIDRINQLQAWRFPTEQTFDSQTTLWYVSNYLYIYTMYYIILYI